MRNDELKRHGILGQKWGKKNGPPYPLNPSDRSAAEKKVARYRYNIIELDENDKKKYKTNMKKHASKAVLYESGAFATALVSSMLVKKMAERGEYAVASYLKQNAKMATASWHTAAGASVIQLGCEYVKSKTRRYKISKTNSR